MPASSKAFELTQVPCPSRLSSATGRSGTMASRSARSGVPPGNAVMLQPPPRMAGRSGCARRVGSDQLQVRGGVVGDRQVAAQPIECARDGVHMRVLEAGQQRPSAQVDAPRARTRQTAGCHGRSRRPRSGRRARPRLPPSVGTRRRCGRDLRGGSHRRWRSWRRSVSAPARDRRQVVGRDRRPVDLTWSSSGRAWGRYHAPMTSVHLLTAGYADERCASSVVLVRDGDALIVVDPGMVASRSRILDPLRSLGVAPEAVTHVFLSHHHPDHTVNIALFAERRGGRLLGPLSRRPVARPRRRGLPPVRPFDDLVDARPHAKRTPASSSRPTTPCTP